MNRSNIGSPAKRKNTVCKKFITLWGGISRRNNSNITKFNFFPFVHINLSIFLFRHQSYKQLFLFRF